MKAPQDMFSGPAVLEIHDVFLASAGGTTLQSDHFSEDVPQAELSEMEEVDMVAVRVYMLPVFVFTCRRLIDLYLPCIYMPEIDRSLE